MKRQLLVLLPLLFLNSYVSTPQADAAVIRLPATGQTTIYVASDDGALRKGAAWPIPRFTDNGNGTVTDNLTGLVWLKNAGCTDTVGGIAGGYMTWANALTFSNSLASGKCGLTDGSSAGQWRLPNVVELESLIDLSNYNPALPSKHPFISVQNGASYWSSTTDAYNTGSASINPTAWGVSMGYGLVNGFNKNYYPWVWPVRGGEPGPAGDSTLPVISAFIMPTTSTSPTVPITTLTATDNVGVTGWCLTETNDNNGCSFSDTKPDSYTFASGGDKTLYAWATDAAGNISAGASRNVIIPPQRRLSVTVSGQGSITSAPQNGGAISCNGSGAGCATTFPYNSVVVLTATRTASSLFSNWGDACSGTGKTCKLTMDADKSATATFIPLPPVMQDGTQDYYKTLLAAYNAATPGSAVTWLLQQHDFPENLTIDKAIGINLKGGYDSSFGGNSGNYSTLHGTITVGLGTLAVENILVY
jgi:hypothetical protein